MKSIKYIVALLLLVINNSLFAQSIDMADAMRADGKIYVVVAVLCIIFIGIIGFLITIDRKVSQLEKEIKS